jgi:outer membrane murein-binding lipoprotein Lpp
MSNRTSIAQLILSLLLVAGGVEVRADDRLEMQELHTTLQVAAAKIQTLESQVAAGKDRNEALAQSAAAANAESNELKDRYEKLRGLLEGLGIGALETSRDQTQDRLLAALSDLRVMKEQRDALAAALIEMAESSMGLMQAAPNADPAAADRVNKAITLADSALVKVGGRDSGRPVADLESARVVSLKADLGIAVLSIGARNGVKPGMPFEIYREDKPIAKVLITEVRNTVCGAVVQELASANDPVRVGDRGRVDLSKSL